MEETTPLVKELFRHVFADEYKSGTYTDGTADLLDNLLGGGWVRPAPKTSYNGGIHEPQDLDSELSHSDLWVRSRSILLVQYSNRFGAMVLRLVGV